MHLHNLVREDEERGIFRVHRSLMTSPQILDLEKVRIFDRAWLYVGHATEVPNPGDYRRRNVGGRPVFFIRGSDGEIRVFLNTCLHRGAMVCRRDEGNAEVFQCFYHAWTYNNQGELIGVPDEAGYSQWFDHHERSLRSPPRVESYRGFVFLSFNPDAEDLLTYLAGAKEYIDLIADEAEEGMRVVAGSNRFSLRANWKLLAENSIDPYHVGPLHATYFAYVASFAQGRTAPTHPQGWARALGNGHAAVESPGYARPIALWHPIFGEDAKAEIAAVRARLAARHGEERARRMAETLRLMVVYPNLALHDVGGITIRTWWPLAPDHIEVSEWALAPKEETAAGLARRLENYALFLGAGGFATPDDMEAIEACQAGFAAKEVEWTDLSRGMDRQDDSKAHDEIQMRTFWRQWLAAMVGQSETGRVDDLVPVQPA